MVAMRCDLSILIWDCAEVTGRFTEEAASAGSK